MQESWWDVRWRFSLNARRRFVLARVLFFAAFLPAIFSVLSFGQAQPELQQGSPNLAKILAYIHSGWDSLTRSTSSCAAVADTKLSTAPVLFLPAGVEQTRELDQMERDCKVRIAYLPQAIHELGPVL